MVGNDIIDIEETKRSTNWQRHGFLDKVFTSAEQAEIKRSNNPFNLVWRFWSMKESAYKVYIQCGKQRSFNPKSIECSISSPEKGEVSIGALTLITETTTNMDYILSVSSLFNNQRISTTTLQIPQDNIKAQSKIIHEQILKQVAAQNHWNKNEIAIYKTNLNIPYLSYKNKKTEKYLSISHHGKYGAFTICDFITNKMNLL